MKRVVLAFTVLLLLSGYSASVEYPKLTDFVTDSADMIDAEWEAKINALAKEIEVNSTAEFAVVTVPTLEGLSREQYAVELFEQAGIGKKDKDNGLLILVAKAEREYRVEVGYGLEPYITDSMKVNVGSRIMEPAFKEGEFGRGIYEATTYMGALIMGREDVVSEYRMRYNLDGAAPGFSFGDIIWFIFIIFMFSRIFSGRGWFFFPIFLPGPRRGGGAGGFGGTGFGGFGGGLSGGGGFGGRW